MIPTFRTSICAAALCLSMPTAALAAPTAMTADDARHLLSRTGFGAAPHEIAALVGQSAEAAVDDILARIHTAPETPMPAWTQEWHYPFAQIELLGPTAEEFFYTIRYTEIEELQQWWLGEMISTASPMTERLVLFWHGHFATSLEGLEHPQWLAAQNSFFRRNAAGNFRDLATGILRDPAMLVYLTNTENAREAPNENLAREYFELFTLGEGRGYTEADISEAARALTGHTVDFFGGQGYAFDPDAHDFGRKTILGQAGSFDASDLPHLVMSHPDFGPYIVEALWLEFVSDQPEPAEVKRVSTLWADADWELRPLLRAMLLSDAFWSPDVRGRLVKGPVDLLVGSVRTLGLPVPDLAELAWATEELGQALFLPPNVGGWPVGRDWLTDASASARSSILTELLELEGAVIAASPQTHSNEPPASAASEDLRIGQAFVMEASRTEDDGVEVLLTLFDVGFDGNDWRSLSFWIMILPGDTFYMAIHRGDCLPNCFQNWPAAESDDPWIEFMPRRGLRRDFRRMDRDDRALLGATLANLPAVLDTTRDQTVWADEETDFRSTRQAASWLADLATRALEDTPGNLAHGFSRPNALGLGGLGTDGMAAMTIEDYTLAREQDVSATAPKVQYGSLDEWLRATPGTGFDSARAAAALLAVPLPEEGRRYELRAPDAEALIRHIVLSPQFQVN